MQEDFVKIINATYKILEFFPEGEPLKNKAKEKALAIMENLTLIFDAPGWISLKKEKAVAELMDDILVLENYLELGKYQGWLDAINFLIIKKEYEKIKSQIIPPKGLIEQGLRIASNIRNNIDKDKNFSGTVAEKLISNAENNAQVIVPQGLRYKEIEPTFLVKQGALQDNSYSDRQRKILKILAQKEKVQVQDIIKETPDVTKRTVRRDLDDLLKKGKITRIGEFNQVFYQNSKKNPENSGKSDRTVILS